MTLAERKKEMSTARMSFNRMSARMVVVTFLLFVVSPPTIADGTTFSWHAALYVIAAALIAVTWEADYTGIWRDIED